MNAISIIILGIILVLFLAVVRQQFSKNTHKNCSNDCSGCGRTCHCH